MSTSDKSQIRNAYLERGRIHSARVVQHGHLLFSTRRTHPSSCEVDAHAVLLHGGQFFERKAWISAISFLPKMNIFKTYPKRRP